MVLVSEQWCRSSHLSWPELAATVLGLSEADTMPRTRAQQPTSSFEIAEEFA